MYQLWWPVRPLYTPVHLHRHAVWNKTMHCNCDTDMTCYYDTNDTNANRTIAPPTTETTPALTYHTMSNADTLQSKMMLNLLRLVSAILVLAVYPVLGALSGGQGFIVIVDLHSTCGQLSVWCVTTVMTILLFPTIVALCPWVHLSWMNCWGDIDQIWCKLLEEWAVEMGPQSHWQAAPNDCGGSGHHHQGTNGGWAIHQQNYRQIKMA